MRYFIQTYGCQMNTADSEKIAGLLEALSLEPASSWETADVLILNTCSVRQMSEDKIYGWAPKVKKIRRGNPSLKVVVTGCMVGSAKGQRKRFQESYLTGKMPWVDYLLTTSEVENELPTLLVKDGLIGEWALKALGGCEPKKAESEHAYVNISTGCDNFCTFCVVPYARDEEKSRPLEKIIREVEHLAQQSYKHITLLGQNVNSWGIKDRKQKLLIRANSKTKLPFAALLRKIHGIDGVEKISFLSSNPFDFTKDLVEALTLPKIDRYLHIAVQSGNDEILKKMNRRHTSSDFLKLVEILRARVPEIKLGTDAIVGFPGETWEQFIDTVKLFQKVKFSVAYIAIYSERPGTLAAKLYPDDISLSEKRHRHKILTQIFEENKPMS